MSNFPFSAVFPEEQQKVVQLSEEEPSLFDLLQVLHLINNYIIINYICIAIINIK